MAGEGPPFLTVGTDVSAKYRGAFCEAKVKVVKKLVKCKINFKSGTSCIVSDDFVKGTLKIGAKVEAKMTESSPYEDGIIMKLNDASLYTVVFDDGDEKTLRRTLLCLQGEKHFHESETLDHLPLTDPENFGTPVVKDSSKMRRKRRSSNRSQRSEDEEEEDDDEESDDETPKEKRKEEPEDAVGKIVIVEMNEKRKNSFFPALIVDPSCTKDLQTKGKDYIVTRSFKDNKFYTVNRSNWKPFLSKDHTYKGDVGTLKAANEKAVTFIDTGQLPSNWDMDLLKKKKAGKQVQMESADDISEDSSDDEYDMEKDAWLASLHKFMEERGTPINKPPVLGFRDLNLYKLYKLVQDHGGCRKVTDKQMWRHIMTKMGIPVPATQQPYNIHTSYNKYLFAFEEFNRKMGPGPRVFTRTRRRSFDRGWISPPPIISRQRSQPVKQLVKDDPSDREEEEESPTKKRVTRKKGEDVSKSEQEESKRETRETKTRSKEADKEERDTTDRDDKRATKKSSKDDKMKDKSNKEEKAKDKSNKDKLKDKSSKDDNVKDKVTEKSTKADKSKDKKDEKIKERSKDTPSKDGDEKVSEKVKDTKGKDKAKDERGERAKEEKGAKTKEEKMELESKAKERGKERRSKGGKADSGGEEDSSSPILVHHITGAGYEVGERVLVHYGRGRTEKIYEAKVVDIELKGKDHVFTVHYTGWNNRYDEAVKKSRIMGSAEKKKKKLTPKGKSDKEKNKKEAERKDREEQQRKEKEEADRRQQEENERRVREERELKEKEEAERLEKARAEKEKQEKERQDKLEKERKEKQLEKERLEKERQEREKLEQEEREKERLDKERQERDRKEKQEKERKEKQEKDRREKVEREKREKEKLELEKQEKEVAEKEREAERERKEKAGKETKKTPTGKRGRPSLSSKTSPLPQTPPRNTPSGRGKSPSPASVFSQRSMRSDRKSLTESPFALGLNVRSRGKRSSTGQKGTQDGDSDSELDELDAQYESQQSTQDSEDSQMKDTSAQEPEDHDDNESTKTEDYAATLTKVGEEKLTFDDDLDEGPPTLIAEVVPDTVESRLQETESEAPKVEEEDKVSGEREGRLKSKKESKIRLRKSIDKERDVKDSSNESLKGEKTSEKDGAKVNKDLDDSKEKIDDTPVLERQVPMEDELKEKLEDLKQETKGSASDADKKPEKKKGRRKGRKSLESRKRSKASAEAAEISEKSEASEASEPKKKHAKVDRRKSDKGGKKSKGVQDSKTPADNTDSDFGTSSIEDKSIPGTSKSFITTPPTTPESSPKMPSSPARDEDLHVKTEYQSSNKSDSDALIEVANVDDRETSQSRENDASLASSAPLSKRGTASQQHSPKKRRRGTSESEQTKKRRKHSRRRQSSISERRMSAKERSNNNSSDTDESRSESRLTSSSTKRHLSSLKKYPASLPPSRVAGSSDQDGSQKQRRWNFLVDLSNVKEPDERIAIIQHQLSELRSVYLQLKQEVATIDRRRKKFRKKEREAAQVMAGVALGHCLSQTQDRMDSGGS